MSTARQSGVDKTVFVKNICEKQTVFNVNILIITIA